MPNHDNGESMPAVTCPKCAKPLDVPSHWVGKTIRCKCGQRMRVKEPVPVVRMELETKVFEPSPPPAKTTPETKTDVITEQTAKNWKALILLGGSMFFLSPTGCITVAAISEKPQPTFNIAMILVFVIGVSLYSAGKIGAYWHHG